VKQSTSAQFVLAALAYATSSAPAFADALQDQVLAGARAAKETDFAFTQALVIDQTGSKRRQVVSNYDPRRTAGARWKLVELDGKEPTAKELEAAAKRNGKRKPSTYADIADLFVGPAKRISSTPERVTYFFPRLPAGVLKMNDKDLSADTSAEAVVNISGKQPYVEQVRYRTNKPFRIALIAKVESLTAFANYRLMPDGRPVLQSSGSDMSGSAMGKSGSMKSRSSYAGHQPVR
jgi:hypothetical protein